MSPVRVSWRWAGPLGLLLLGLLACAGAEATAPAAPEGEAAPKGDRLLGIDINAAADGDYDAAFRNARRAGIDFTSLTVYWDDLESVPGEIRPDPDYLAIAEAFYPVRDMSIALTVAPIDTNHTRLPDDLAGRAFDDPEVIERFKDVLDFVDERTRTLDVPLLAIGNEVDAELGTDEGRWRQYEGFFAAVADRARQAHPEAIVGVKATYGGLMGPAQAPLERLTHEAGAVFVTYYAIGDGFRVKSPAEVEADIDRLAAAYPDLPIYFLEIGCPSGEGLGSSEQAQADFVRAVFRAWDRHPDQILGVNFTWLTDASAESVDGYGDYYGLRDPGFLEFLATLGLRTHAGQGEDKAAFGALLEEAARRGW